MSSDVLHSHMLGGCIPQPVELPVVVLPVDSPFADPLELPSCSLLFRHAILQNNSGSQRDTEYIVVQPLNLIYEGRETLMK